MNKLLNLYLEETDIAGYIVDDDDHPLVLVDRGEYLHIINENPEEEYIVGRWYKSTCTKSGDYSGCPDFEGSLVDCLEYIRDYK